MNGAAEFSSFIESLGFAPPARLEPGRFARFATSDKRADQAGYAKLFPDMQGGIVGDFRSGEVWTWQAQRTKDFSEAERKAWGERIERERKEAEALKDQEEQKAAQRAREIWEKAQPAPEDHAYLTTKGVQAHGLKLYRGPLAINGLRCDGSLILPLRNAGGDLRSLEFISPQGEKRFLPGGNYKGCYFAIGQPGEKLTICEGFATGATIHETTALPVRIAATAGNLADVANAIREKAKDAELILCADNDRHTVCHRHKAEGLKEALSPFSMRPEWCKCNPGVTSALEATRAVKGLLAVPELEAEGSDFNDMAKVRGLDAVRAAIEGARSVEEVSSVLSAPSPHGWPAPEPLPELPAVPPFSFDALPGALRGFVHDIAERMQCPAEFPAVGALVMAGAAIGCRIGIRPKKFDAWTVVPNLWGMLVGKPGIMKSPALGEAIAPLKRMQAKAFEEYESARADYEISAKAQKLREENAASEAKKALRGNKSADVLAMLRSDPLEEPKPRRYVVNDSTPEALCETLKDNPNGVLCERDELVGLLRSMDREGHQEARALYLTAADGDKSFTVDRIMRGSARHIERLCVSIVGGIQPGVMAGYVRDTQRSGAGDDGLLQRFGLMVYPDVSGKWCNVDRPEDREAKGAVYSLIERLCALTPEQAGAELDPYGGMPSIRFAEGAQALFIEWLADLETRIRTGEDHPAIISHLAKYRKTLPALALVNHLCDGGTGPVTDSALSRALLLIELLEAHARRVYSYAARPDLDAAKTILAKLKAGKLPLEFTARMVHRKGWSGLTAIEEATAALRVLEEYGYLRERIEQQGEQGGRPSTIYRAHPSVRAA